MSIPFLDFFQNYSVIGGSSLFLIILSAFASSAGQEESLPLQGIPSYLSMISVISMPFVNLRLRFYMNRMYIISVIAQEKELKQPL